MLLLLLLILLLTVPVQANVLTTLACPNLRTEPFRYRLDLFYFYRVEYNSTDVDLHAVEQGLATRLTNELSSCDVNGQAEFGVMLTGGHRLSEGGAFRTTGVTLQKH